MMHFACDFAKEAMQVAYAGTGIWLSDGATNILPVPVHPGGENTSSLTAGRIEGNRRVVHTAWKLHFEHVRHSLVNGFYQSLDAASERLRNFIEKAAQATLVGEVFDDAATGQGLLNYFLRAINCGAITAEEAQRLTGLTRDEFRSASFMKILDGRKK
jgi:hypothetical protein